MKNSFRKYFENWRYVAADRKFYGTIQWREDIYYDYEYEMVFDSKFEKIESGKAKVFDNQKRLLNTVYFGNSGSSGGLKYKAISSRMTCICNQENCSWKLSGCKNEPNNDPSSNYYWGNSWAKSAKGNIFLGYTKRYNGHNLAAKDKLYCQSASSEGCEETTFNFKGLLLKENNELIRWLDYQTALNSTLVKLKSVLDFVRAGSRLFPAKSNRSRASRRALSEKFKEREEVDDVNIEILIEANWIHESVARECKMSIDWLGQPEVKKRPFIYDIPNHKLLPTLDGHTLAGLESGAMLMIGGWDEPNFEHTRDIWILNENAWKLIGSLQESNSYGSALRIGDYIYVVSGDKAAPSGSFPVERINVANKEVIETKVIGSHAHQNDIPIIFEATAYFCVQN
ncbi:Oidioi.mRNA.OKI2018_I69.chr2.g4110.t1.cds [Oikopleura dioica]|uniref:Oidioi.mRNA.OKI2018_I69.chr2.g4110.t1.cds n=1 Tax=Oikopleura dioica TaxID=34765 RepID=A0ABN7SWS5_OIKDI|nr:Oidioi.mRNA.OKI2018_I69.chr2.g4110.t1.cds [Oikopleura dioica]